MYQIRRLPAAMALARERFIEFKDILYSSPMTMPRDVEKGGESSLPAVEQLVPTNLHRIPIREM